MASHDEHCADCVRELGQGFSWIHIWLDQYFDDMGTRHRAIRHHLEGIEEVRSKWGGDAALAAEIHIRRDFDGRVPSRKELEIGNQFLIDWSSGIGMV